jgi:hypothetical protein
MIGSHRNHPHTSLASCRLENAALVEQVEMSDHGACGMLKTLPPYLESGANSALTTCMRPSPASSLRRYEDVQR